MADSVCRAGVSRASPDRVELLMVLAGVVTSGSSWAHSAGGRAGFSSNSWRSPGQGAASRCSVSAEMASLGSRPELSLCLLLSVSEELDVDNCCLNEKPKQSHIYIHTRQRFKVNFGRNQVKMKQISSY